MRGYRWEPPWAWGVLVGIAVGAGEGTGVGTCEMEIPASSICRLAFFCAQPASRTTSNRKRSQRHLPHGPFIFGNESFMAYAWGQSSAAKASTWARLSLFRAERIRTTVGNTVRFLEPASIFPMTLAAVGAQEPFSIKATVRF